MQWIYTLHQESKHPTPSCFYPLKSVPLSLNAYIITLKKILSNRFPSPKPSREVINKEIAYRWTQEVTAMGKFTNDELKVVYKQGMKPSEYLANKDCDRY